MRDVLETLNNPPYDVQKIREDFDFLKVGESPTIYLDNGATTQRPRQVLERVSEYYKSENANPLRGTYHLAAASTEAYEQARKRVAKFINARTKQEIIFTRNASEALNLVAYSYGFEHLEEGDEVLITRMEHHSNSVPWQFVCQKTGAKLVYAELDGDFQLDMDDFASKLSEKTKIVSFTGTSNVLSSEPDVKKISEMAHSVGAIAICDGAQMVPHHKVDVQDLGCDFLALSGHKMYAPFGIGVLYGKRDILQHMQPFMYGGEMIEYVQDFSASYAPLPYKFEAGTQNVGGAVGLHAAIDYVEAIGFDKISAYEQALGEYCAIKLRELGTCNVFHPTKGPRGAAVAFNVCGVHPHDVASILDYKHVAIRAGHHCAQQLHRGLDIESSCRASFGIYNTKEEIDAFIDSINFVRETMGLTK